MAIKELKKSLENKVQEFIEQGGTVPIKNEIIPKSKILLRIPKDLIKKIDIKRKERILIRGRTAWILEAIEKALSD